jgi:REP element-mobilizing transposase RayT
MIIAYRGHLPHFQNDFKTYFVTFVTRDRLVLPPFARDIVLNHVVQSDLYFLHAAVVMPDHVHLLITPGWRVDGVLHALCDITRRLKGSSAREVNLAMRRRGSLWQRESFDHQLRQDESLRQKGEYICNNPVRWGLVGSGEEYRWLYRSDEV